MSYTFLEMTYGRIKSVYTRNPDKFDKKLISWNFRIELLSFFISLQTKIYQTIFFFRKLIINILDSTITSE